MRRAGKWHRGGRDKTYQEDTAVEANEEAAFRNKQMCPHESETRSKHLARGVHYLAATAGKATE
jgi:hypothetical protein